MITKKAVYLLVVASFILLAVVLLTLRPSAAQEPDGPPPAKDSGLAPGNVTSPSTAAPDFQRIDRSLLPKIEPQLVKRLLTAEGKPAPFIVYLKVSADVAAALSAASSNMGPQALSDPAGRRAIIVNTLKQTALNSQGDVLQILNASAAPGGLSGQSVETENIRPLWIVNAVAATGTLETVLTLAAQPDVAVIRLDKEIKISRPFAAGVSPGSSNFELRRQPSLQTPEWGLSKIRADLVHDALGIDGTGVVVANIDSGVDWLHPALQASYRGYTGAGHLPQHPGNWFDASGDGAAYPIDTTGHGTHTMGTMVGAGGIGVAPGAKWVAVKAFSSSGSALNSWLHNAFQWILAPAGDPALAPDIVNNSWSSTNGFSTEFEPDIQALLAAGIFPLFSAGNSGPGSGTINSPASLNAAFSVGATDINDDIALFSSRGPSPWGMVKPEISAPGKDVRSTLPGGTYGELSGTSMAAPHAAGLAALLLQASPTLANNLGDIATAMASTATPFGSPIPNNSYGWGRIDAYNAVMSVASVGTLQGLVSDSTTSATIENALIQITPRLGGPTVNTVTAAGGDYIQGLAPESYHVVASAFGYQSEQILNVTITTNTATIQNFNLIPQPTGQLSGTVRDRISSAPLSAAIIIEDTPARTNTNPVDGSYSLSLPLGVYTVTVVAADHRITKALNINIAAGQTTVQEFLLDTAPSILIVDSGRWYQESQISYYQQALDDLLYPYDTWPITRPFESPNDIPPATMLSNYDVVVWSAPFDSPGYIGADDELAEFLLSGGNLLLSGQDIAFYDDYWFPVPYLEGLLKASFEQDNAGSDVLSGSPGEPFAGLSVSISDGDGADNQFFPDVISNASDDFAGPLFEYGSGGLGGLHVDLCVPYRAVFFSFGYEGISTRSDRNQVMGQAVDWLIRTPDAVGVELTPQHSNAVGNFGTTASHTVRLRNTGAASDQFTLTRSNGVPLNWPVSAVPSTIALDACDSQEIVTEVQIPTTKDAIFASASRSTKTPAPVLLVDDDRWLSYAQEFRAALEAKQIPYDYWFVPKSFLGPEPPSPPLETLQMYPLTVWYTAYDWFQPLTSGEEDRLASYLNGGGRLFLSSQDYLYRHLLDHNGAYDPFPQDYLGIQAHTEDYSSTLTIGRPGNPVGTDLGPYVLTFPPGYDNFTDALTPTTSAQVATVGQAGQPNGITNAGVGPGGQQWQTVFLAYGPELLQPAAQARLLQRSVGWLSWLGRSTIEPVANSVADGSLVTYTTTITNNGWDPIASAYFTATFPTYLTPVAASPGVNLINGEFIWHDALAAADSRSFTYTAQIVGSIPFGSVISQTSWLAYAEHDILFDRISVVDAAPALGTSMMTVSPDHGVKEGDMLSYTIVLANSGLVDAPMVVTTNTLPAILELAAVDAPSSGTVNAGSDGFSWTTPLARGETSSLTFQAIVRTTGYGLINNVAYVDDGTKNPVTLSAQASFKLGQLYLPVIAKN
jgi:uncharacterized repeat protein (TIGR01451 family)